MMCRFHLGDRMNTGHRAVLLVGLSVLLGACSAHSEPAAAAARPDAGAMVDALEPAQPTAARAPSAASSASPEPMRTAEIDAGSSPTPDTLDAGAEVTAPQPDPQPAAMSGSSSIGCQVSATREVELDEQTARGTARALRDAFAQAASALDPRGTPFRWSPRFGGTTTVVIGDLVWGEKATYSESDQPGCEDLRMPVSIRFTTQDALLDERVQGWVRETQFSGSFERPGKLSEWLVEHAQHPGLELDSLGVIFSFDASLELVVGELNATAGIDDSELTSDLYSLAKFDDSWPRGVAIDAPYERVAPIDALCAALEPADMSVSFSPGIADLSRKLSRVWLRCSGMSTGFPTHDGIAITETGWKHIAYRDGAWVEQPGFGHEGAIEILDTSINGPGSQQVAFWDMLPVTFASPSVDLSTSATTLQLMLGGRGSIGFEGLYIASEEPVAVAQLPYADGVRAGAAACDKPEGHLHRVGAAGDVSAALVGSWVFCSGGFRPDATGIELSALGTYNHLAADGSTVASGLYTVVDTGGFNGAGSSQVNLTDFDGGRHIMSVLIQSDAPIKLTFGLADGRGVLSAR
jgi:hypothetical protein